MNVVVDLTDEPLSPARQRRKRRINDTVIVLDDDDESSAPAERQAGPSRRNRAQASSSVVVDDDDVHVSGASPGQSARSRNNQRIPSANASPARASTGGLGGVGGSAGGAAVAIAGTAQGESEGDMPAKMECVICLCGVKKPAVTRCGHLFCNSCIRDWLKSGNNKCPTCRKRCIAKDLRLIFCGE
eukprot:CAMPEP_0179438126 /NCGR_PEP_ID=MMETSP0799-20121207/21909_1 /TAXON_ID=46947 /ORGANISM="Geminigera cryophila, Strain CCMP2564" /LENGTH=185 /DNA_ID=CAMNT_0021219531 /DNA_START=30 /DNA_END=587 /DNA_ORIENTATION=+